MVDSKNTSCGVVPLQPVHLKDQYGFQAALYSINAMLCRRGKKKIGVSEACKRVSALVSTANPRNLCLMLQEWYMENSADDINEILETLPRLIEKDDPSRYGMGTVVNYIEWGALATIHQCCIAVKFLKSADESSQEKRTSGWTIAVPTPKIFGMNTVENDTCEHGTPCLFIVCHRFEGKETFLPLIPSDQSIFFPGKSLCGQEKDLRMDEKMGRSSKSKTVKGLNMNSYEVVDKNEENGKEINADQDQYQGDFGTSPDVKFEGYVNTQSENGKNFKHVTFTDMTSSAAAEPATSAEPNEVAVNILSLQEQDTEVGDDFRTIESVLEADPCSNSDQELQYESNNSSLKGEESHKNFEISVSSKIFTEVTNETTKTTNTQLQSSYESLAEGISQATEEFEENKSYTESEVDNREYLEMKEGALEHEKSQANESTLKDGSITAVNVDLTKGKHFFSEKPTASVVTPLVSCKSKLIPIIKEGRLEVEIGEISEATVLFHRVYGS